MVQIKECAPKDILNVHEMIINIVISNLIISPTISFILGLCVFILLSMNQVDDYFI